MSFLGQPSTSQLSELKISNDQLEIQESTQPQHFQTDEELAFTNAGTGHALAQVVPVTSPHPLMSLLSQVQLANSGGPGGSRQPPAAVLFNPGTEAAFQAGGDDPVTSPHPLTSLLSQVQLANSGGSGGTTRQPPAAVLFNPGTEAAFQAGGDDQQLPEGIKYPKLAVHKGSSL